MQMKTSRSGKRQCITSNKESLQTRKRTCTKKGTIITSVLGNKHEEMQSHREIVKRSSRNAKAKEEDSKIRYLTTSKSSKSRMLAEGAR
jgi:hypothetical protein